VHWRLLRCGSSLRVIADPLQRDPGEPREAEDPATGGREIDHPTARIWAPIGDRNDNTAPISVIGNAHLAPEGQRLVRGGQCTIVQMATARRVCAQLACRIERCNAAFGTRARLTLAASSRQPPPANAMNSRRLTSSMGAFSPMRYQRRRLACAQSSAPSNLPQGSQQGPWGRPEMF